MRQTTRLAAFSLAGSRAGMTLVFLLRVSGAASAGPTPNAEDLLKRVFENYRATTSVTSLAMTVHRAEWERRFSMTAWTRGGKDALVRFIAPAMDAGNATLQLGGETWVFNPKLNAVIKLPPGMMSQSWMGSDFSYDDLSKSEDLLTEYRHRVVASDTAAGHVMWTVEATPNPGAPVVWGKVVLKIRDDYVITEETFLDQDMRPVRRMQSEKIGLLDGRAYPTVMVMYPLDKPTQFTRVETLAARFNTPVAGYVFSLSNLQNPRP